MLRFKQLLGVTLDELKALLAAEEARAALRAECHEGDPDAAAPRFLERGARATSTASSTSSAAAGRTSTR